ncbi:hypothetical protein Hanom_Chr02g00104291 [Helianthus anomalus]
MDGPLSLTLTLGRPDIQLSNTSYNNEHAPPSLGSMAMAILQLSDPLNDISYNNEQATSVGSVAMARLQPSEPVNDISYNNEKATSVGSVAMVRLQLSDQLTDTSYSYSNEQAPSIGYEREVSQSVTDGVSYYALPPSLADVVGRDESYSGEHILSLTSIQSTPATILSLTSFFSGNGHHSQHLTINPHTPSHPSFFTRYKNNGNRTRAAITRYTND